MASVATEPHRAHVARALLVGLAVTGLYGLLGAFATARIAGDRPDLPPAPRLPSGGAGQHPSVHR